jgi:hypothetical protein
LDNADDEKYKRYDKIPQHSIFNISWSILQTLYTRNLISQINPLQSIKEGDSKQDGEAGADDL